jgi:MFS family permease
MTVHSQSSQRWVIAGLLFAAGFINYLDRAILSVALPLVSRDLHLDPRAKGVLLSAFFWSYALMQLPVGLLADRISLRRFYAGMFALWCLACGFTGLATTLGALIVLRVALGIGESVYLPGGIKVVSLLFESGERGLASGLVNCGTRVGLSLGAPLTAWMLVSRGWHQAFVIFGFGGLLWLVPWFAATSSMSLESTPRESRSGKSRIAWRDRNFLGLCLGHLGYSYYWYLLVTWLPDYLVESRHMPIQRAGVFTMIPFMVFSIGEPLGGWIADRLVGFGWSEPRVRKWIITASFLTAIALIPAVRVNSDTAAICLIGTASLVGLATGNILALLQLFSPPGEVGMRTGALNFAGNLSGVAAPLVTGLLISRTSSYIPGFDVAVVLLIVALPAYWLIVGEANETPLRGKDYARTTIQ